MKYTWFYIILIIVASCQQKSQSNNKSDVQNKIIGDVELTAKWMEYNNNKDDTTNRNDYRYINVKINKLQQQNVEKEKLLYLNFDMQKDFVLVVNEDSIPATFCQRIENGISGSYDYIVAFEEKKEYQLKSDYTLVYNDKVFGIGTVAFVL